MAIQRNISSSLSTLTCTSTGSPPTNVTWMKDGETLITNGTTYSLTQTLVDRVNSTYKNTLTIEANVEYVVGEYSCKVANSIGTSNMQETDIKGKNSLRLSDSNGFIYIFLKIYFPSVAVEIRGHEKLFIVGLMGNISCSTILNSTSMVFIVASVKISCSFFVLSERLRNGIV